MSDDLVKGIKDAISGMYGKPWRIVLDISALGLRSPGGTLLQRQYLYGGSWLASDVRQDHFTLAGALRWIQQYRVGQVRTTRFAQSVFLVRNVHTGQEIIVP